MGSSRSRKQEFMEGAEQGGRSQGRKALDWIEIAVVQCQCMGGHALRRGRAWPAIPLELSHMHAPTAHGGLVVGKGREGRCVSRTI
jgi:hypothetical protein